MKIGDEVRATYPYGGVPSCSGTIINEVQLGRQVTQFLVSFETRPGTFKKFHLTKRELTLLEVPEMPETLKT